MPLDFPNLPAWLQPAENMRKSEAFGESMARNFMSAYQQAHEEKVQAPMNDLRMQQMKNNLDIQNFTIQRDKDMLQTQTDAKAGEKELAGVLADTASNNAWNEPTYRAKFFDVGAKNPSVIGSKIWQDTILNFQKADKADEMAQIEAMKAKARENVAKTAADARVTATGITADSRTDVADINAGSRENVANINADSREAVAKMRLDSVQKASSILDKASLESYKGELHTIWSDSMSFPKKTAAIVRLNEKYGVTEHFSAPEAKPLPATPGKVTSKKMVYDPATQQLVPQ